MMWKGFLKADKVGQGFILTKDLFTILLGENRNPINEEMFVFIDMKSVEAIKFGEYVELVCVFCSLNTIELLK